MICFIFLYFFCFSWTNNNNNKNWEELRYVLLNVDGSRAAAAAVTVAATENFWTSRRRRRNEKLTRFIEISKEFVCYFCFLFCCCCTIFTLHFVFSNSIGETTLCSFNETQYNNIDCLTFFFSLSLPLCTFKMRLILFLFSIEFSFLLLGKKYVVVFFCVVIFYFKTTFHISIKLWNFFLTKRAIHPLSVMSSSCTRRC